MAEINKLLKKRVEIINIILKESEKYFEIIKNVIRSLNVDEYNKSKIAIIEVVSIIEYITSWKLPKDGVAAINIAAELYQKFPIMDENLLIVIAVLENKTYAKSLLYNMSATYAVNIQHEKNRAIIAYDKYIESAQDDDIIIEQIITNAVKNVDNAYAWIVKNDETINKFTIKLINAIITKTTQGRKRAMELIIEKQKDRLLGSERLDLTNWKGVQGTIVRYNLLPVSTTEPHTELFARVGLKYNTTVTLDENFKKMATEYGVVVINKSTNSPVEFDITKLISGSAPVVKTNQMSGLTKTIIEKYNTAKMLTRGVAHDYVKIYKGDRAPTKWYVVETINGMHYRFLGRGGEILLPADSIHGLLHGLSTRAHMYNIVQSNEILAKCYDKNSQLILSAYADKKLSPPSTEPIKTAIVDKLTAWFTARVRNDTPSDLPHLRTLFINRHIISEIVTEVLTGTISAHGRSSSEYMLTYISKFDSIIRAFTKELDTQWLTENINIRVFKEYQHAQLQQHLIGLFSGLARRAVDYLDRTNTWVDHELSLKEFIFQERMDKL